MVAERRKVPVRKKRKHFFLAFVCVGLVILGLSCLSLKPRGGTVENANKQIFSALQISSRNVYLECLDDGEVMLSKASDAILYPASITKIMTAIVALENLTSLDEMVYLNEQVFENLYALNASLAGFLPGEEVSANDLLYGLLFVSGAECGVGLAQHISGSEQEFVALMNEKARQLGMNNTHFENATGLHHNNHYSTAYDLSIMMRYAFQNNRIRQVLSSRGHTCAATNMRDEGFYIENLLHSQIQSLSNTDGHIIGGKTGYTLEAGRCLASVAEINSKYYLLVTCGAEGDTQHIEDALAIYAAIAGS